MVSIKFLKLREEAEKSALKAGKGEDEDIYVAWLSTRKGLTGSIKGSFLNSTPLARFCRTLATSTRPLWLSFLGKLVGGKRQSGGETAVRGKRFPVRTDLR